MFKQVYKSALMVDREYDDCIADLIAHEEVQRMKQFMQHADISCLRHCLFVSFLSYLVCKKLKLDYRSAARGALLHDLFLYDWHLHRPAEGLHAFSHPGIALSNANRFFALNHMEQDIIAKHMWPLTIRLPRYKESMIVLLADKYCALFETIRVGHPKTLFVLKMRYAC